MPRLDRHLFVPRSGGYRLHHLRELRHKVPVLLLRKYLTAVVFQIKNIRIADKTPVIKNWVQAIRTPSAFGEK